ncbi:uncharacterized protein LOC110620361 isoform X2 [Manihot esculenta]|uniref:C2H2-type domain-containing protein n=1 Tax=Manihot esculenta TaxID=3983 RepID=A0A2C9VEV5_MANES|nr:uncharacterized protein LOC110620361 isoform X2 [Manihot esculenta]OAY43104.1 hypothetical protein MANES_08G042700v8 [Manihot esculenta]
MPGIAQRNEQFSNASSGVYSLSANGFWSKHRDDVSYNQLQKFWSELSPQARQKLLRIDKQTLFEQARKNMYCSRCNGLLLEGFLQIVMYGKSLQQEGVGGHLSCNRTGASKNQSDGESNMMNGCQDEIQDPSVHPWGGLTAIRDGSLTLLNCYLYSKSLKDLQNVFDSARARERERELLYPDACGGGGRGWISQGMASYGRGHGTRETCALHTARLSCDTLVDFWSALGEETRQSLLRMKEEDFIERLMYRDCRRNVIREFKELKELKRMRREPRCTSWFCVADTAFQYEVSDDTIQADWRQTFADTVGSYHHFEWAVGTGEGKSDILEFENVGMNGSVQVHGLDLGGLTACFITLRAWKLDGRCTELSVKAHALRGQQCVHGRLVVGDGFVTITRGESIRRFFEHAEEAEEDEDDDSMDKDGSELDGECSRPQKHAKSPELAREFLLDAATVIFKEQVEKAFREGTARQNAHSIFVCLALKLLEERVHVACKEIITLEKQMKLLEEEEKEKREEEERKERRRTKEREKKLRRKERLKGKERDKEKKCSESNDSLEVSKDETSASVDEDPDNAVSNRDTVSETGDISISRPGFPNIQEQFSNGYATSAMQDGSCGSPDGEVTIVKDGMGSFMIEQSKFSRRRLKFRKEVPLDPSVKWCDGRRLANVSENGAMVSRSESRHYSDNFETPSRGLNGLNRQSRINGQKPNVRNCGLKFNEKFHSLNNRMNDKYDYHSCSCHQNNEYRVKVEPHVSAARIARDCKSVGKAESTVDMSKQFYRGNKYGQIDYMREGCVRPKSKIITANNSSSRDLLHSKKVWEPTESHRKYARSNSDCDVTLKSSNLKAEELEPDRNVNCSVDNCSSEVTGNFGETDHEENHTGKSGNPNKGCQNGQNVEVNQETPYEEVGSCLAKNSGSSGTSDPSICSGSNSDNCSSCLSEGDSNTASSSHGNLECSSTSDSEDTSQQSEGRETSLCQNSFSNSHEVGMESMSGGGEFRGRKLFGLPPDGLRMNALGNLSTKIVQSTDSGIPTVNVGSQHQGIFPPMQNQNLQFPVFQAPSLNYYHQNPVAWPAAPPSGLMPFPHTNHYLYAGPLSYGLNGNSRLCMQYSPVQQLATPIFNPGPVPVYQPVGKPNGLNSEEQLKMRAVQEALNDTKAEKAALAGSHAIEVLPNREGRKVDNSAKLHVNNTSFSLFHFGGPVALSTGCKPDPLPSKDGIVGDISSKVLADEVENDAACNKKEATVEEYNLFAASNGIRFSIF